VTPNSKCLLTTNARPAPSARPKALNPRLNHPCDSSGEELIAAIEEENIDVGLIATDAPWDNRLTSFERLADHVASEPGNPALVIKANN
jgi:hypothetical protein